MRITKSLLNEYMELEAKEKAIHERKEKIRLALISNGSCTRGDITADVAESERLTIKTKGEVYAIVKDARLACRLFKRVRFHKVSVRRRPA